MRCAPIRLSWVEMDRRRVKPVCTHECWPLTYGGTRRKVGLGWVIEGRFGGARINVFLTFSVGWALPWAQASATPVEARPDAPSKKAPAFLSWRLDKGLHLRRGAGIFPSLAMANTLTSGRVGVGAVSGAGSLQPRIIADGLAEIDLSK